MPLFLQLIVRRLLTLSIWIIRRRLIPNSVGAAIAFVGPGGDLLDAWWVFLPETLAIVLFGVGWNLFSDGLTEALDPKRAG
jgi:ABC-type dipeptide/oligopeptide/nickel transport system permease subunit